MHGSPLMYLQHRAVVDQRCGGFSPPPAPIMKAAKSTREVDFSREMGHGAEESKISSIPQIWRVLLEKRLLYRAEKGLLVGASQLLDQQAHAIHSLRFAVSMKAPKPSGRAAGPSIMFGTGRRGVAGVLAARRRRHRSRASPIWA
eukprot:6198028-Pleurochrysis_carterae.AAC.4